METANRDEIKSCCPDHHIQTADALPALAAAVQRDQQIYPESADGHPNSAGYRLIAETVKASL
jgi:lysophospholipase L1-like esterase